MRICNHVSDTHNQAMPSSSSPVLALGMHRSGTSYLASLLAALGVRMGEEMLAADLGNPRGYFEDVSVLAFHKTLLARRSPASQTRADFLPAADFDPSWTAEESAQADALLAKLTRDGAWGWKEPRTCLFLAQWLEKMPDARCVAVYRHPLEIYYSFLKRRDWSALFAPESVFEATAVYNEAILAARKKSPERFLVIHAGASFADGPALAGKLSDFLELPAPDASKLPPFAAKEFSSLNITQEQHDLMALAYPRAAKAYAAMQAVADKPAEFARASVNAPATPEVMQQLAAALAVSGPHGVGQGIVDAFCLNVPADELRCLREGIAADVDAEIADISADRDKYIANFDKYKAMYENYFEAWKGTDRTLAETRAWINGDLLPKIASLEKKLTENGISTAE